jgi:FecR protein
MKQERFENGDPPTRWSAELKAAFERPGATDNVRDRLLSRAQRSPSRVTSWFRPLFTASVFAVGVATVMVWRWSAQPERFMVGALMVASRTEARELYRDDDSAFVLAPGAQGRVDAVGTHEIRLSLLHGRATGQIRTTDERPWHVTSGAFTLRVLGAHFELAADDAPAVRVVSGTVLLTGPCGPPREITKGETTPLSCPEIPPPPEMTPEPMGQNLPIREATAAPKARPHVIVTGTRKIDDRLREEINLVDRMRATLDVDPAKTLALAAAAARAFPGGMLGEEREAMTIIALDATGKHAEARKRAQNFVKTFPSGTFARRIRVILSGTVPD